MPKGRRTRASDRRSTRTQGGARPGDPGTGTTHDLGVGLIALKLFLVPVVVDPDGLDSFSNPKVITSEIVSAALAVVIAAFVLRHGLRAVPRSRALALVAVFALVAIAATALAVHPYTALFGAPHRFLGLTSVIDGAIFAVAIAVFVVSVGDLKVLAVGVCSGLAVVLAYGALQLLGADPIRWAEPSSLSTTVGNRDPFAAYVAITVSGLCVGMVAFWRELPPIAARALAALTAIGAVEVMLSGARAPAVALGVGLLMAVAIAFSRGVIRPTRRLAVPLALTGLVAVGIFMASPAGQRLASTALDPTVALRTRLPLWEAAVAEVRSRPWLGVGPDGLAVMYQRVRSPAAAELLGPIETSTHNWALHYAVGVGLVGLIALLTMVGGTLAEAVRQPSPVRAAAVTSLVVFLVQGLVNVDHIVTQTFFWAAIGLGATVLASPVAPGRVRPRGRRRDWPVLALIALVIVGGAAAGTNSLGAERALSTSFAARGRGDMERARQAALAATARDPGRAAYWNALGLTLARDPARAADAFRQAAQAAPFDSVYRLNLARAELLTGDPSRVRSALEHAENATRIDPQSRPARLLYARALITAGDAGSALTEIERSLASRRDAEALTLASSAYAAAGLPDLAIDKMREAIALVEQTHEVDLWRLRLRLAELLIEKGALDEARVIVVELLAFMPADPDVQRVAAALERRSGSP